MDSKEHWQSPWDVFDESSFEHISAPSDLLDITNVAHLDADAARHRRLLSASRLRLVSLVAAELYYRAELCCMFSLIAALCDTILTEHVTI